MVKYLPIKVMIGIYINISFHYKIHIFSFDYLMLIILSSKPSYLMIKIINNE